MKNLKKQSQTGVFLVSEWRKQFTGEEQIAVHKEERRNKSMQKAKKKMPAVVSFNVLRLPELSLLSLSSVAAHVSSSLSRVCYEGSSSRRLQHCSFTVYFHGSRQIQGRRGLHLRVWNQDQITVLTLPCYYKCTKIHFLCFSADLFETISHLYNTTCQSNTVYLQLITLHHWKSESSWI